MYSFTFIALGPNTKFQWNGLLGIESPCDGDNDTNINANNICNRSEKSIYCNGLLCVPKIAIVLIQRENIARYTSRKIRSPRRTIRSLFLCNAHPMLQKCPLRTFSNLLHCQPRFVLLESDTPHVCCQI